MKMAFVAMHPAPYRDALIEKIISEYNGDVDVYNLYESDVGHKFWALAKPGYKTRCISAGLTEKSRLRIALRLIRLFVLGRKYYCTVWPGYVEWPVRVGIILSAMIGRRYVLCVDSVEQPRISRIALAVKKWMINKAELIFVPGVAGKRFIKDQFAVPDNKIVCGVYALDGLGIRDKIESKRAQGIRETVRKRLNISSDATVFLMVANMIPTRKYSVTSAGFLQFEKQHPGSVFVMVGKGHDYAEMQRLAELNPCLRTIEGCSFDMMIELYAASDVYVHGGKEPASTALIIGAIAGLPLVSSDAVGCSFDVIVDGKSGFKVEDYLSAGSWSEAFGRAILNKDNWTKIGQEASAMAQRLDASRVAKDFVHRLEN